MENTHIETQDTHSDRKDATPSKLVRGIGKIIFTGIGIIVTLLVLEGLARLAGFKKDQGLEPAGYYSYSEQSGYDITPNFREFTQTFEGVKITYKSNDIGCFDADVGVVDSVAAANSKQTSKPILLVGDSFTWGFTPFEHKWGTKLEDYTGNRVLKCGVNGYGTKQELVKAENVIEKTKTDPSLIVVGYFFNDFTNDYLSPSTIAYDGRLVTKNIFKDVTTGEIDSFSDQKVAERYAYYEKYCHTFEPKNAFMMRIACYMKKHSIFYPYVKDAGKNFLTSIFGKEYYGNLVTADDPLQNETEYLPLVPTKTYPWLAAAWKDHLNSIAAFQKLARAHHSKLLVVLIPDKTMVYPGLAADAKAKVPTIDYGAAQKRLHDFLNQKGIMYDDLIDDFVTHAKTSPDFETKVLLDNVNDLYWRYDGHWNPKGNELAGLLVSKFVLEHKLLPANADFPTKLEAVNASLAGFK